MACTTAILRDNPARRRRQGLQPETAIQVGIMNYLRRIMKLQHYGQFMAFHVPNGGARHAREAALLRDMGVMAGIADIVILIKAPRHGWPLTLFIELKHQPQRLAKKTTAAGKKGTIVNAPAKGQQTAQEAFQERVDGLGFDYRLVAAVDARDGLNQVLAILKEYQVVAE